MVISCLAAVVLAGPGAPPKFPSLYGALNGSILKNDAPAITKWYSQNCGPEFTYRSHDGNVFTRKAFLEGVVEQCKSIEKVGKSATDVVRVQKKGAAYVVTVKSTFEGQVRFDGTPLRLVDKSTTEDTWVAAGNGWRMKRSVQTAADTQMFNDKT